MDGPVTYGIDYDGTTISDKTQKPGIEDPIYYWVPSIAPCGMTFVTSDIYPNWKGHLLVGSLKFQYLELVKLDGAKVIGRQKLPLIYRSVRNVAQGRISFIWGRRKGNSKNIPN
jgi:glucose/arabinose dehydrogenase